MNDFTERFTELRELRGASSSADGPRGPAAAPDFLDATRQKVQAIEIVGTRAASARAREVLGILKGFAFLEGEAYTASGERTGIPVVADCGSAIEAFLTVVRQDLHVPD